MRGKSFVDPALGEGLSAVQYWEVGILRAISKGH